MTRKSLTHHRLLRWVAIVVFTGGLIVSGQVIASVNAVYADASGTGSAGLGDVPQTWAGAANTSGVQWVDGGDDSPCLNDDTGRALTALPSDKWCTPIPGCYQDDDGKWVLPSRSTGIWQGDPSEVKYADELGAAPNPTTPPPSGGSGPAPSPTTPPPSGGSGAAPNPTTPPPSGGSGTAPGSAAPSPSSPGQGSATSPNPAVVGGTSAAPGTSTQEEGSTAPNGGEPSAPAAPTLTASGSDLHVTWAPNADADVQGVTGYVVEISWLGPVEVDASTTEHTFAAVPDGTYIAVVRAVNAFGSSPSSAPSDSVTVGVPVAEVVGAVQVDGSLTPGGTVTITGSGYAPNVPDFQLELHSTPVLLDVVTTDGEGRFSTSATLPDTVEPGDHTIVVFHDGIEVSRTPVQVAAIVIAASGSGGTPSVVGLALLVVVVFALAGVLLVWRRLRSSSSAGPDDGQGPIVPERAPSSNGQTQELQEVN